MGRDRPTDRQRETDKKTEREKGTERVRGKGTIYILITKNKEEEKYIKRQSKIFKNCLVSGIK